MAVTVDEITKRVAAYGGNNADIDLIRRAYNYSSVAHTGQTRKSGEPYIEHPMHVALILTQLKLDAASIVAAILHDTVEDTPTSIKDVHENFGDEVAELVDGVTKLSNISFQQKHEAQAESFRKMLLAMAKDIRVILIKLADRVHNMRTLKSLPEEKQKRISQETMDIYAPLANRLGISWIKIELEDQAFRYLKPMAFHRLNNKLNTTRKWRDKYIDKVIDLIQERLADHDIEGKVSGRHKHLHSICRKMEQQALDFDEVADILAFRIIVAEIKDCYEVLGLMHSLWKPIPGKFKDYVAMPKINMYQSLHTTVTGPEGERIEIQIRTQEMHDIAEEGIAAHWIYKESGKPDTDGMKKFKWLRSMMDWQQDLTGSNEFIESVKLDLFEDRVYVFTPTGDVKELPRGATPIDFAFNIHTDVGLRCTGARVNGKIVPIRYKLQNGDKVEIITSDIQKPNKDWLKIVVTSKAKAKIRAFLRADERDVGIAIGRELIEKELKKLNLSFNKLLKDKAVLKAAETMNYLSEDDMLMALGYGKLNLRKVINRIIPDQDKDGAPKESIFSQIVDKFTPKGKSNVRVDGIDNVLIRIGKCCTPIPGDAIVGFVTRGRGVTVHRAECKRVLEISEDRRINVSWEKIVGSRHQARIRVFTIDTPGVLADLSKVISNSGANITSANIATTIGKKAMNDFQVELKDTQQLNGIIKAIEKVNGVLSVERIKN